MPATRTPETQHDEINAAFLAHFEAAGESRSIVAWDTEPFDTTAVPAFVRFGFQHNVGTLAGITGGASQFVRRFGIVSAVVYVRKGQPAARRNALTEICMAFLEQLNVGGFSIFDPGVEEQGLVNGWNQVNCTAQARYDLTRTA
jgi:hypothetical protein